jgi:hypothetical protein
MDTIWTQLPRELVLEICKYLDSATRRDIGIKPRRLTELPRLNLHVHSGDSVFFSKDDMNMFIMRTPESIIYERCRRIPFMIVHGVQIFKTEGISLIMWNS